MTPGLRPSRWIISGMIYTVVLCRPLAAQFGTASADVFGPAGACSQQATSPGLGLVAVSAVVSCTNPTLGPVAPADPLGGAPFMGGVAFAAVGSDASIATQSAVAATNLELSAGPGILARSIGRYVNTISFLSPKPSELVFHLAIEGQLFLDQSANTALDLTALSNVVAFTEDASAAALEGSSGAFVDSHSISAQPGSQASFVGNYNQFGDPADPFGAAYSGELSLSVPVFNANQLFILWLGSISGIALPSGASGSAGVSSAVATSGTAVRLTGVDFFDASGRNVTDATQYSFADGLELPRSAPVTATPEPGTMGLVALGFVGLLVFQRRRNQRC